LTLESFAPAVTEFTVLGLNGSRSSESVPSNACGWFVSVVAELL
jgi:hypothetical protein